MRDYLSFLRESAEGTSSLICLGVDPVLEEIPLSEENPEKKIIRFYHEIFEGCRKSGVYPSAIKPNIAFFEQYGFPGMRALRAVIRDARKLKVPVILDVKRGDIGKTSFAYARACFDVWNADAVTLNPYMGREVLDPFVDYFQRGKGAYVLCRTSNPSAAEIQDVFVEGGVKKKKLYEHITEKIIEWHVHGVGIVVGATVPEALHTILMLLSRSGKEVPLLVPGIGTQGGSLAAVLKVLKESGTDLRLHRINSSSGICLAYQKEKTTDFAGAAVRELKRLNKYIKESSSWF